jgi:4-diphosphocytidyl-2-C-methyl-D-erythritol kinase
LAQELGADVAFCTMGGTVAATGRGDDLRPLDALPRTWFLLVHPEVAISTVRVYNSPLLGLNSERPFAGKTASFRRALGALAAGALPAAVFNRMESAVFPEHPRLAAAKRRLLEAGCAAAAMSGSGSTIFGICESREQAAHIADVFKDYQTSIVATTPAGVERIQ